MAAGVGVVEVAGGANLTARHRLMLSRKRLERRLRGRKLDSRRALLFRAVALMETPFPPGGGFPAGVCGYPTDLSVRSTKGRGCSLI